MQIYMKSTDEVNIQRLKVAQWLPEVGKKGKGELGTGANMYGFFVFEGCKDVFKCKQL